MNASDQIAQCELCRNYARSIDPSNWEELFNITWLQIREKELRDPGFHVDHYSSFFWKSLKNTWRNQLKMNNRRDSRFLLVENVRDQIYSDPDMTDQWSLELTILDSWLNERPDDEYDLFLKNIITLRLKCKTIKRAVELTEMSERSFKKYLKEAYKELDYAYFLRTDCHPLNIRDLLRVF